MILKEMSVMKKYLHGLAGLALLGGAPLLAQTPVPIVIQRESRSGPTAATEIEVGPHGPCGNIVCVPEHYIKKTDNWCYSHIDLRVCLCHFHGLFGHCGCDDGHCEHPYCRRVMVKKLHVEECERTRCVPQVESCCEHGCCPGGNCLGGAAPHAALPMAGSGAVYMQGSPVAGPGAVYMQGSPVMAPSRIGAPMP
jgi:hypothetical protein